MAIAVFDGIKWGTDPNEIEYDNMIVFRNISKFDCYLRFTNPKTFGIDLIGLEPGSEVHLPFRQHTPTECKAFCGHIKDLERATVTAVAVGREAVETTSETTPCLAIEPLSGGGTEPLSVSGTKPHSGGGTEPLIVPWPSK